VSETEFNALIEQVVTDKQNELVEDYVNGRVEVARRSGMAHKVNPGSLAVEAHAKISADPAEYAGKQVLKALRAAFRANYARNLKTDVASVRLREPFLASVAAKVPKPKQ